MPRDAECNEVSCAWKKGELNREMERWRSRDASNKLDEYAGVATYYLDKKLATFR